MFIFYTNSDKNKIKIDINNNNNFKYFKHTFVRYTEKRLICLFYAYAFFNSNSVLKLPNNALSIFLIL